jgi:hypothetical protein
MRILESRYHRQSWTYAIKSGETYFHFPSGTWKESLNPGCLFSLRGCHEMLRSGRENAQEESLFFSAEVVEVPSDTEIDDE